MNHLRLRVYDRRWQYKVSYIGERAGSPGKKFEVGTAYVARLEHAVLVSGGSKADNDLSVTKDGNLVMSRRGGVWLCRDGSVLQTVNGKPIEELVARS